MSAAQGHREALLFIGLPALLGLLAGLFGPTEEGNRQRRERSTAVDWVTPWAPDAASRPSPGPKALDVGRAP